MYLQHLYVTLEPESLAKYRQLASLHRLEFDQNPKLTIMISRDNITADPDRKYESRIEEVALYFSTAVGGSSALAGVISPDAEARFVELCEMGVEPAFGYHYFPHSMLLRHFPPLRRRYRNRLNQVSLDMQVPLFIWGQETVVTEDFSDEPSREYNELWMRV